MKMLTHVGWRRLAIWMVTVGVGLMSGCAGGSTSSSDLGRVDPDQAGLVGGLGIESADLRAMCDQFVRSLLETPEIKYAQGTPRVVVVSADNRISDVSLRFDTDILLTMMRAELTRSAAGKIRFLDRSLLSAVDAEELSKNQGRFTRSGRKPIAGADFFMTGIVQTLVNTTPQGKATFFVFSFRLTDAANTEIVWEDVYQSKRVTIRGSAYR